jgi:hypothetical protein
MKNHRWLNCTEFSFFWVCSGRKFMNDCICVLADMLVLNFFFGEVSLADPDQVEPWRFGRQRGRKWYCFSPVFSSASWFSQLTWWIARTGAG